MGDGPGGNSWLARESQGVFSGIENKRTYIHGDVMGNSFQDQLLKLGLVDKKQVEKAKKDKHQKRKKPQPKKQPPVDENKLLAEEALRKKKERARQLNLEREEKLKKRELAGRVRQMIETTRLPKNEKGHAFRFVDGKKIFRVFVDQEYIDQLESGKMGIVRLNDQYEVCPAATVKSLRELDAKVVVHLNESKSKGESDDDDPYAGYEVPDDLVW